MDLGPALTEFVENYKPKIDARLQEFLESREEDLSKKGFSGYYDLLRDYVSRGGKRLRPISCLASYLAFGGNRMDEILTASLSVEFLHNSSLIHDDIMDRSNKRRGGPAFHVAASNLIPGVDDGGHLGISLGILGGDSLLEMGVGALISSGFPAEKVNSAISTFVSAYRKLIEGQILDLALSRSVSPSEDEVLRMLYLKTGALLEASLTIGGILAGAGDEELRRVGRVGKRIGIAFQIWDDYLGLYGDPAVTGKPVGSDVREGKRTLLVVKALELADLDGRSLLLSALGNESLTEEDLERVREIVREVGALDYSLGVAEELVGEALAELESLRGSANDSHLEVLRDLCRSVIGRNR